MSEPQIIAREPIVKTPAESKIYVFPFDELPLAAGELLTGTPTVTDSPADFTISAIAVSTGDLVAPDGRTIPTGQAVTCRIAGGTKNRNYLLTCTAASNQSNTHEVRGWMYVR